MCHMTNKISPHRERTYITPTTVKGEETIIQVLLRKQLLTSSISLYNLEANHSLYTITINNPSTSKTTTTKLHACLRQHLNTIHRIHNPSTNHSSFGFVLSNTRHTTWPQAFLFLFERLLQRAEDLLVLLPYEHIRNGVKALDYALDDVVDAVLITCAGRDQVVVDVEKGEVVYIAALEKAIWGDVEMERLFWEDDDFKIEIDNIQQGQGGAREYRRNECARRLLYRCYFAVEAVVRYLGCDEKMDVRKDVVLCLQDIKEFLT